MQENSYKYDAFISYRHLGKDSLVAGKLQKLLEGFKVPRGVDCEYTTQIKRIFRDETELTSSGDLNNEIKEALEQSRFLIVVCSEETQESKWCVQEVEYFKYLHGGHLDNILTILVNGEPEDAFMEQLCYETQEYIDENGNRQLGYYEVEPLAANVSGRNKFSTIRKLKREYLRLAAAIVGCDFDALYQRHKRRRIKRAVSFSALALLLLCLMGNFFAEAEANKAQRLYDAALSFVQDENAAEYQKALYYLAQSAMCSFPEEKYQDAAIHNVLREAVLPVKSEKLNGKILGNAILAETASEKGYGEVLVSEEMEYVTACNPENGRMLTYAGNDGYLSDNGKTISNERFLTSCDNGRYWIFAADEKTVPGRTQNVTVYDSELDRFYSLAFVAENNPAFEIGENEDCYLSVDVCEAYALITCRGYYYLYTFEENGYVLSKTISSETFLSGKSAITGKYYLASKSDVLLSERFKVAAVKELAEIVVFSLEKDGQFATIPSDGESVSSFSFLKNENQILVSYGDVQNTKAGRWALYAYEYGSEKYECIYTRQTQNALAQAIFAEDGNTILARDFANGIYITTKNVQGRYEDCGRMYMPEKIKAVAGGREFAFAVSTNENCVYLMNVVSQREKSFRVHSGENGYPILDILSTEDEKLALLSRKCLQIMDTDGSVLETHSFDTKVYHDFVEANRYKFQGNFLQYDTYWGKWNKNEFPGSEALETNIKNQMAEFCRANNIALNADMTSVADSIRLSQDGKRIFVMKSSQPCLCSFVITDNDTAELEHGIVFTEDVPKALLSCTNGKQIAVTTASGKVFVYSVPLTDTEVKWITAAHTGDIRGVCIDETGRFMALSIKMSTNDVLELWDLENMRLLDVRDDGNTALRGLCFVDNKLYYGFGEYVCCMNVSGSRKYAYNDYKLLSQLCGMRETTNGKPVYFVEPEDAVKNALDIWSLEIHTNLSSCYSESKLFDDKFMEVQSKALQKSDPEKLSILRENKDEMLKLYSGLKDTQRLSQYYQALIQFTKAQEGVEAATMLAQEYCDALLPYVCKTVYEWNSSDRPYVQAGFCYYVLEVYSAIEEAWPVFNAFFNEINAYNAKAVEESLHIYDAFKVLELTQSTLSTLVNDTQYILYVINGELDVLEQELSEFGFTEIYADDNAAVKVLKQQWMMRLAMLRGDVEAALGYEAEIYKAFPEDYEMNIMNDWEYFKIFKRLGIISETDFDMYYSALEGFNGVRDRCLVN